MSEKKQSFVPDWAEYYTINNPGGLSSSVNIEFYSDHANLTEVYGAKDIFMLAHDLAVGDVLAQMRDKPLSERVTVKGDNFTADDLKRFAKEIDNQLDPSKFKLRVDDADTYSFKDHVADNVNNPKHYQLLPGVEVYDVRNAILKKLESRDDVTPGMVDDWSRAWEYLTRMWEKNGQEDASKCRWYLNKLLGRFDK